MPLTEQNFSLLCSQPTSVNISALDLQTLDRLLFIVADLLQSDYKQCGLPMNRLYMSHLWNIPIPSKSQALSKADIGPEKYGFQQKQQSSGRPAKLSITAVDNYSVVTAPLSIIDLLL